MSRSAVALLLALTPLLAGLPAAPVLAAERSIPPGHEETIQDLFPASAFREGAPTGHVLRGLAIEYDRIRLTARGPAGDEAEVWLREAGTTPDAVGSTRFFDVVSGSRAPASLALARWVLTTVRERETTDVWAPVDELPRTRDGDVESERPAWATVEMYYVRWVVPGLWLFLALAGIAAAWQRRRTLTASPWLALVAITGLAVALRLLLPPGGAGDLKNTVIDAYGGWPEAPLFGAVDAYGRGVEGLLVWLFLALPTADATVAAASLVLAVASVPLLHSLARRLGYGQGVALTAALLLAVCPLHIRFGPTVNRYTFLVFLVLLGWLALLAWLDERRPTDLLVALFSLSLASQCRPEAIVLPLFTVGLLVARGTRATGTQAGRPAWPWLTGFLVAHALLLAVPDIALLRQALSSERVLAAYGAVARPLFDPDHNPFLSPHFTPVVWPVLAALGLVWVRREGKGQAPPWPRVAWLALTSVLLGGVLATQPNGAGQILNARYQLTATPLYLLLTAAGIATVVRLVSRRAAPWARWLHVALALAVAATVAWPMGSVVRDATMNQEYRFLRDTLAAVPDGCAIVTYYPSKDLGLRPQPALSRSLGRNHQWMDDRAWHSGAPADVDCAVFYEGSACSAAESPALREEAQQRCGALKAARQDAPLAETTLARVPIREERYASDPVPVAFHWLRRPTAPEEVRP